MFKKNYFCYRPALLLSWMICVETYDTLQYFTDEQRVSDLEGSNTERIEMFLAFFRLHLIFSLSRADALQRNL